MFEVWFIQEQWVCTLLVSLHARSEWEMHYHILVTRVCSFQWNLAVFRRAGFHTSIVMLWEKQSRRTRICTQISKRSTHQNLASRILVHNSLSASTQVFHECWSGLPPPPPNEHLDRSCHLGFDLVWSTLPFLWTYVGAVVWRLTAVSPPPPRYRLLVVEWNIFHENLSLLVLFINCRCVVWYINIKWNMTALIFIVFKIILTTEGQNTWIP